MNINDLSLYPIALGGFRHLTWTRYYNANHYAAAIVAVMTTDKLGDIIDWTAYLGGTAGDKREEEAVRHIAEYTGCKLSEQDARYFFPELENEWYRT
jgi:hypothetical protein